MEAVVVGVGIYAYKKIHKRHDEQESRHTTYSADLYGLNSELSAEQQINNNNVRVQKQQHYYAASAVESTPAPRPLSDSEIHQYLREATLKQLLAMLVDGVYSRDRGNIDLPGWVEGAFEEDERAERYTSRYWTRMKGISTVEEKQVGLKHYLRREPDELANGWHNRYRLVIALRGTKMSSYRDIKDDIRVAHHTLHCSSRYKATQLLIEKIIASFRSHHDGLASEICITGHSLGAAIALSIGRDLAKDESKRYAVHCFNPPFISVLTLIQKLTCYEKLKTHLKDCELLEPFLQVGSLTKQVGKLLLAKLIFRDGSMLEEELRHFCSLIDWKPVLYVNKADAVCKEYQRFYEWKNKCALQLGLPIHMQALVTKIVYRNAKYSTLVPSVDMYISKSDRRGPLVCHVLKQWFRESSALKIEHKEFQLLPAANLSWKSILPGVIKIILHWLYSSGGEQSKNTACFDDGDEEISPGSAEAFVLESDT